MPPVTAHPAFLREGGKPPHRFPRLRVARLPARAHVAVCLACGQQRAEREEGGDGGVGRERAGKGGEGQGCAPLSPAG